MIHSLADAINNQRFDEAQRAADAVEGLGRENKLFKAYAWAQSLSSGNVQLEIKSRDGGFCHRLTNTSDWSAPFGSRVAALLDAWGESC